MQIKNFASFLFVCIDAFIGSAISARSQRKLNNFKKYWQKLPKSNMRYRFRDLEAVQERMRAMRMNKNRRIPVNPRFQKYLSHFNRI